MRRPESHADHLCRIDDPGAQHVDVFLALGVKAEALRLVGQNPADDDRALDARVLRDLPDRSLDGARTMSMPA